MGMPRWLEVTTGMLNLAPAILQLIIMIEGLFGKGQGALKSQVVQAVVQAAAPTADPKAVQGVIDGSVTALNSAGVFKK